jgi:hypothetical protein
VLLACERDRAIAIARVPARVFFFVFVFCFLFRTISRYDM